MPAFITHELFGTQIFSMMEGDVSKLIDENRAPYFWGLQGPDLLFFRDALLGRSSLPSYGGLMHTERADELFCALSCYLNVHKDRPEYETLAAYILGFIGHYCLDSEAHPYIYYKQMQKERVLNKEESKGIHHRIESDIDTALYELTTGRNIREYRPAPRLYGTEAEHEIIAQMYVTVLWEVYGVRAQAEEIKKSFSDCRMMLNLCLDRRGNHIRLVEAAEALIGKPKLFSPHIRRKSVSEDILNLKREEWYNLATPQKHDNRSFPQIFYAAAYRALDMMNAMYSSSQLGMVYEGRNLLSFDNGSPDSIR